VNIQQLTCELPEQSGAVVARRRAVDGRHERQKQHRRRREDVERDDVGDAEELRHEHEQDGPDDHVPHAAELGVRAGQHLHCTTQQPSLTVSHAATTGKATSQLVTWSSRHTVLSSHGTDPL